MIPLLSDVLGRKILKKLCQDSGPEEVFQTFNNLRATKVEISDKPLNQQRYDT